MIYDYIYNIMLYVYESISEKRISDYFYNFL